MLVAIDLDGTLLTRDGTMSARTMQAVREAQKRGAKIILASARPPQSVEAFRDVLGLTGAIIAYNGALSLEPETGRVIHEAILTPSDADTAIAIGQTEHLHVSLYVGRRWMVEQLDPTASHEAVATAMQPDVVSDLRVEVKRGAHKVLLIGAQPRLRAAAECVGLRCPEAYAVGSLPEYLEIVPASASKGAALRVLAMQYGVPRSSIVAIGDGQNDISLFAEAGYAVAMGNATAEVQARADAIAPTNDADGVAWVLDGLLR
jgi:Cof subfamily protein (haloacid dehalogenase superfamily)